MHATLLAQAAYRGQAKTIRTDRALEYDTFARVTQNLGHAAESGQADITGLAKAVHDNRRLWNILAADAADPKNGLADGLRAQIVYLAEFTRLHSSKVLAGQATLAPLIDINSTVMRGLGTRTPQS